jgi:hypothetical protein
LFIILSQCVKIAYFVIIFFIYFRHTAELNEATLRNSTILMAARANARYVTSELTPFSVFTYKNLGIFCTLNF